MDHKEIIRIKILGVIRINTDHFIRRRKGRRQTSTETSTLLVWCSVLHGILPAIPSPNEAVCPVPYST